MKSKTARVIHSILKTLADESKQQFQPFLTAVDQVLPSITNDFNDPTLTPDERAAGGKRNDLIRQILNHVKYSPLFWQNFLKQS